MRQLPNGQWRAYCIVCDNFKNFDTLAAALEWKKELHKRTQ